MNRLGLTLIQLVLFSITISVKGGWEIHSEHQHELFGNRWLHTDLKNESSIETTSNKVNIKVYYETLCPGSINFVTNQLRPAVERLAPYLDIHMVPYGHAKTQAMYGQYSFECQHGPLECYGNKIHACAVDVLKNNTQAALFNACVMQFTNYRRDPDFDYAIVVNWCNYKLNIHTKGIWACVNGERGSILLKNYGEETRALGLRYIPYILIEDSIDRQDEATRDLISTVCRILEPTPTVCYK